MILLFVVYSFFQRTKNPTKYLSPHALCCFRDPKMARLWLSRLFLAPRTLITHNHQSSIANHQLSKTDHGSHGFLGMILVCTVSCFYHTFLSNRYIQHECTYYHPALFDRTIALLMSARSRKWLLPGGVTFLGNI